MVRDASLKSSSPVLLVSTGKNRSFSFNVVQIHSLSEISRHSAYIDIPLFGEQYLPVGRNSYKCLDYDS